MPEKYQTKIVKSRTVSQNPGESEADCCRRMGWVVGTRLVGDEGYGPTTIEITAIGNRLILAKAVNRAFAAGEATWTLACRDWQPLGSTDELRRA